MHPSIRELVDLTCKFRGLANLRAQISGYDTEPSTGLAVEKIVLRTRGTSHTEEILVSDDVGPDVYAALFGVLANMQSEVERVVLERLAAGKEEDHK